MCLHYVNTVHAMKLLHKQKDIQTEIQFAKRWNAKIGAWKKKCDRITQDINAMDYVIKKNEITSQHILYGVEKLFKDDEPWTPVVASFK